MLDLILSSCVQSPAYPKVSWIKVKSNKRSRVKMQLLLLGLDMKKITLNFSDGQIMMINLKLIKEHLDY